MSQDKIDDNEQGPLGRDKKNRKSTKLFATFYACYDISWFITFLNDFCHFAHVPAQDVSSLFLTLCIGILSDNVLVKDYLHDLLNLHSTCRSLLRK